MGFVNYKGKGSDTALVRSILDRSITELVSDEITTLSNYSLAYCNQLTTLKLKNLLVTNNFCLSNCLNLSKVDMSNCAIFGYGCLEGDENLTKLKVDVRTNFFTRALNKTGIETLILTNAKATTVLSEKNTLANTPIAKGTGYIYVPAALIDDYKTATNWTVYADQFRAIEDYPDICGGVE